MALVLAVLWGSIALSQSAGESLWLDELHTAWSASGKRQEVAPRAALGNQLSPYFHLMWLTSRTFGFSEAVWRAPSVIAWISALALSGWYLFRLAAHYRQPMLMAVLALIVCDRAQIFYATEARPYALLALVNLMSWLALAGWTRACAGNGELIEPHTDTDTASSSRHDAPWPRDCRVRWSSERWLYWLLWCVSNSLSFWLQPIAGLSIAAQFVYLVGVSFRSRGVALPSVGGLICLALSIWPALHVLKPVWEHRQLWAGFAAGHRLVDVLQLLPFTAFLGPLLIGVILQYMFPLVCKLRHASMPARDRREESAARHRPENIRATRERSGDTRAQTTRACWMWLCAWSLPCLAAYVLTATETAPLMHRRYVFTAAVPLVLWSAHHLARVSSRRMRWCVLVGMLALLLYQQGSFTEWGSGRWPAAVRGEDWRGASQWINAQTPETEGCLVFCGSSLIEGQGPLPEEPLRREYLSFPLQSLYRIRTPCVVYALVNDPRTWRPAIDAAQPLIGARGGRRHRWLVVRASAAGFESRLERSRVLIEEHRDFGGVQVARLAPLEP